MEAEADRTERTESAALRRALELDPDELAFLRSAALPLRFAALVQAQRRPRAQLVSLLWVVLPAAVGYAAWLAIAPLVNGALDVMAQAGSSALLATLIARTLWGTLDSIAAVVEVASAVPGFNAPLITLSLIAVALYACAVLFPTGGVRRSAAPV